MADAVLLGSVVRLAFRVLGVPVPQGSVRPIRSASTGRTFVKQSSRMLAWRQHVAETAERCAKGQRLYEGPASLSLRFFFLRPRKPKHPEFPITRPDLDKLARACLDALTGVVLRDDSQVCSLQASKRYGEPARVEIELVGE